MNEIGTWISVAGFLLAVISFIIQSREFLPDYQEYIKLFMVFSVGIAVGAFFATLTQSSFEFSIVNITISTVAIIVIVGSFILIIILLTLYAMFGSPELIDSVKFLCGLFIIGLVVYGIAHGPANRQSDKVSLQELMLIATDSEQRHDYRRAIEVLILLRDRLKTERSLLNAINDRISKNEQFYLESLQ